MAEVKLKVAEANPRDVGRGIARIDPEVMERLEIADTGEVISLKGKRETVAKIMPTFPDGYRLKLLKLFLKKRLTAYYWVKFLPSKRCLVS